MPGECAHLWWRVDYFLPACTMFSTTHKRSAHHVPTGYTRSRNTLLMKVLQLPVLGDNYSYLLHDPDSQDTAVIDPGDADAVAETLRQRQWRLTHIFNTHHHSDHTAGNLSLREAFGCDIYAASSEAGRIPGVTRTLVDGQSVSIGSLQIQAMEVPGHTLGHLAYYMRTRIAPLLFCGDTLFSLGCGRLFEGDARTMWHSLSKLCRLPDESLVYCAHEYTMGNAAFALQIDPGNKALEAYSHRIRQLRECGIPSIHSMLGDEKACTPFLRADQPAIKAAVDMTDDAEAWEVFARLRQLKDSFR